MCRCIHPTLYVTASSALTDAAASPVVLTVNRTITDVGTGNCFALYIPVPLLRNINTNLVQLTDGTTTYDILTRCTDTLRYDRLVLYALSHAKCDVVRLLCSLRPASGTTAAHIACKTCLPHTTYTAPATAATPETPAVVNAASRRSSASA